MLFSSQRQKPIKRMIIDVRPHQHIGFREGEKITEFDDGRKFLLVSGKELAENSLS